MKRKLTFGETLSITSMLFGLFFGAGNLIFPAYMGQMAGRNVMPALLGFLITGVGMPLLAVISLGLTGSSGVLDLSSKIGKRFGYFFTCALYLTIGPFFACPRCVTVPYEIGVKRILPAGMNERLALFLFSLVFFILILWFSLRPGNILTWIGKLLNPIFIVVLGVLLVAALVRRTGDITMFEPQGAYDISAVTTGILDGYGTMDTLAGLAFGIIVVDVIRKQGIKEKDDIAFNTVRAGIFGCGFMGLIYILVALAGAGSRGYAELSDNGGAVLADIATRYFSGAGALLLAAIVFFACLKTVIGLVTSCASCFTEMFPGKLSYKQWAVLFSIVTFAIANVGLTWIIRISLPVLMMLYPLAITLILLALLGRIFGRNHTIDVCVMFAALISSIFDLIKALPAEWTSALHLQGFIGLLDTYLPLFKIGFGWVCPTVIGLGVGIILSRRMKTSGKEKNLGRIHWAGKQMRLK